ncbi:DUF2655 domain-containing protein [Enterobacillus tribolii]|nr:DUF2655 domain-containing protein [Enterobacillus tribolii]
MRILSRKKAALPIPYYRPDCYPQPANCLISHRVLRHCCAL